MNVIFYLSAVIAVLSTVMVITRANAAHALLYLVVSLLAVAVVMYTLGAPFAAALEVIVYAGAIIVLFVFVVMMLNLSQAATAQERGWLSPRVWIGPALLSAVLAAEFLYLFGTGRLGPAAAAASGLHQIGPQQVGALLFGPYLLTVELGSMLLLAGLVGAYHIARGHGGAIAPDPTEAISPGAAERQAP